MSFEIKIKDACTLSSDKTITAREALALSNFPKKEAVVACRVNREQRPLSWELVMDSYIEFITTDSIEGIEVYTRTLAFLLTAAATASGCTSRSRCSTRISTSRRSAS